MANSFFQFKQFIVHQDRSAMKVTTDGCLFGAWAAQQIKEVYGENSPVSILDIGAGTGLLSLMLAQKVNAIIDAIEIEEGAFAQAEQNFRQSPWHDRLYAIHGDASVFFFNKSYEIIVSNPPFYQNDLRSPDHRKNNAHHDKSLLLRDVLNLIGNNLADKGLFFLMFPYKRTGEIKKLIEHSPLHIRQIATVRQTPDHDPFRILIAGDNKAGSEKIIYEALTIMDAERQYTTEFTAYLKDYYLHLEGTPPSTSSDRLEK